MAYNDRKKQKSKRRKNSSQADYYSLESDIASEKRKARELRHSAWWKKKIAAGKCYYCGKIFSPSELTMDHKIPLARGGLTEKMNVVPACKDCNNKKKYLLPHEWDEYMNKIREFSEE